MANNAMAEAGFAAITRSHKRLICNIQSIRKSAGKTRLALTARKPIGYISVEIGGEEGVADSFIPEGANSFDGIQIARVRMEDPQYPDPTKFDTSTKPGQREYDDAIAAAVQTVAQPAMDAFYAAYYASLANMATTVVDTGTDLYQLARLADFGRLEKIPQLAYAQVKRAFAKIVDDAFSTPGHSLLFLHHMKDRGIVGEDKKWSASGNYEMDGCMTVLDKVQANIELWREDLTESDPETDLMVRFWGQITDSRHSPSAMGKKFSTLDLTFADIATAIMPTSKRSDWE